MGMTTRKVHKQQKFHEVRRSPHMLRSRVHDGENFVISHDGDTVMQVDEDQHNVGAFGWSEADGMVEDSPETKPKNRSSRLRSSSSHFQGYRKKGGVDIGQGQVMMSSSLSPQRVQNFPNGSDSFIDDSIIKDSTYYQKRMEDMQHDPAMLMLSGNLSPEKKKDQFIYTKGQILNNRYVIYKKLGSGTFGVTIEAFDQVSNALVAIKVIKKSAGYYKQAQSEIDILRYLNQRDPLCSSHVVRMLDHFLYLEHQCIVFELLSSSLLDLLRKNNHQGLSLNLVRRIGYQLFEALSFLASGDKPVSHCDIKPENVLLEDFHRSALRLIDFGSSCYVNSEKLQSYVQSRYYRAPEVLLGLRYNSQIE
jgi:hypothetical protein